MDEFRLALLLFVVVVCIMAATKPVAGRRRGHRPHVRHRSRRSSDPLSASSKRSIVRNRWDRTDISRGIGRDHVDPDGTVSLWPVP